MNLAKAFALLAAVTALAGCSAFDPYPTYPSPPDAKIHDPGPRVAICYDGLVSSAAAVQRAAQAECAADRVANRVDTDWLLQYCPLLLPARATFVCAAKTGK
jgi:hypothetical protein